MTNIKDIGKQLMGEGLNAFHRKVGLESIEKNNEMQTKILQGIYSQVDDNYLEKTEESNVIHLDGSGDGVVEIESVEGNSLVNIAKAKEPYMSKDDDTRHNANVYLNQTLKANTTYTFIAIVSNLKFGALPTVIAFYDMFNFTDGTQKQYSANYNNNGIHIRTVIPEKDVSSINLTIGNNNFDRPNNLIPTITIDKMIILEGDWTNKEIPLHFEGLQSSFEEKKVNVNGDDKYEIEILLNNKNLFNKETVEKDKALAWATGETFNEVGSFTSDFIRVGKGIYSLTNPILNIQICAYDNSKKKIGYYDNTGNNFVAEGSNGGLSATRLNITDQVKYIRFGLRKKGETIQDINKFQFEKNETHTSYVPHKLNKIKLLVNEPLRVIDGVKDRLCVKDDKLVIERNTVEHTLKGSDDEQWYKWHFESFPNGYLYRCDKLLNTMKYDYDKVNVISNKYPSVNHKNNNDILTNCIVVSQSNKTIVVADTQSDLNVFKASLSTSNLKFVAKILEPFYEEVTNEYGEPILLEGYENGTLYIDSVIVPTTSVRYTQKFESRNELKNLNKNNILITNDINSNIIPYMMEVDMMIMEKEMALMSQLNTKNIMKMEVLDMTSMQKRTFDMLKRLIEGKSLTEQECKDRVLVYLDANKITNEQATELMLIIAEVYR